MAETNSKNDYLRLLFNAVKGVPVTEESELRCEKCGTINPPSSHYCRHCGKSLNTVPLSSTLRGSDYSVVLKTEYDSLIRERDSLKKTVTSLKQKVDNSFPSRIKRFFRIKTSI